MPLKEEVYLRKSLSFEKIDLDDKVFKLNKALYGLKQDPNA